MAQPVEQHELDLVAGALLVEPQRAHELLAAPSGRHRVGKPRVRSDAQPLGLGGAETRERLRESFRRDHSDRHRLACKKLP